MNLLILGNGYDLASNLPTSYQDYFFYRFNESPIKDETKRMKELLKQEIKPKNEDSIEAHFRGDLDNVTNFGSTAEQRVKRYNAAGTKRVKDHVEDILNFSDNNNSNVNFWDVYFLLLQENQENTNYNWSSVEEQLFLFLTSKESNKQECCDNSNINVNTVLQSENFEVLFNALNYEKLCCNLLKYSDAGNLILYTFLLKKYKDVDESNIYSYLLQELELFEEEFRDYIERIMKQINQVGSSQQRIYRDNILKLTKHSKETTFILNFNYTSIASTGSTKENIVKSQDTIAFSRSKERYTITEQNVHGKFDEISIFGIDQQNIKPSDHYYIFTKTYRKISAQQRISSNPLPKPSEVTTIIFYGHSLASADYSYFQSVFDYYDIYDSNVKLVFQYSIYDTKKEIDIKNNQFKAVTKLLRDYGETMNNKNHGNNLVHKLILEDRLSLEEVKLESINSKQLND